MAGGRGSLEQTSTWAVAIVCLIIVALSIGIEHFLHSIGKLLLKKKKHALYESLDKVKTELMLLGFISLLLIVGQDGVTRICIPESVGATWHPCKTKPLAEGEVPKEIKYDKCADKGKVPLISYDGIHQLHIFIFVLAIFHILYCILTLVLGRLKMRRWKRWERETKTADYQFSHDPERFRFTRDTTFGRRHLNFWSRSTFLTWIACFFRQFFVSVSKDDYLTLRHGFVTAHLAPESHVKFDFQKYINRSLEEDFREVVGISPIIWFFAVLFLLANTHGWNSYVWLPFIPLIILLTVGTKLQVIITRMAVKIMGSGDVIKGVPVVQPDDHYFWFNRPKLMLDLIHFVLFQNAFQLSLFVFTTYKFGIDSCFHEKIEDVIIRVVMGVVTQILCSYVTLPLYALVTQMGSNMKPAIFNDRVATALKKWHQTARKHIKENRRSGSATPTTSRPATPLTSRPATPTHRFSPLPSGSMSPVHLLRSHQGEMDSSHFSHRTHISEADRMDIEKSINTYRRATEGSSHYYSDGSSRYPPGGRVAQDDTDEEKEIQIGTLDPLQPMPQQPTGETRISIDFSFDKRRSMK